VFRRLAFCLLAAAIAAPAWAQEDPPLRDPMRPFERAATPFAGEAEPRRLQLTAVLLSASRRVAVINGAIHREGDWIDGAQITQIGSQSVRLRRGNEEIEVSLATARSDSAVSEGDSA